MKIISFLSNLNPDVTENILKYSITSGLILLIIIELYLLIRVQKDINKLDKKLRYLLKKIVKNTTIIKKIK